MKYEVSKNNYCQLQCKSLAAISEQMWVGGQVMRSRTMNEKELMHHISSSQFHLLFVIGKRQCATNI